MSELIMGLPDAKQLASPQRVTEVVGYHSFLFSFLAIFLSGKLFFILIISER